MLVAHLRSTQRFDEAEAALDRIARRDGGPVKRLEETARLAFARGNREQARQALLDRIAQSPSATAHAAFGRFLLECGEIAAAAEISERLLAERAELATVADLSIDVALAAGEGDVARALLLTQVDLRPSAPAPLLKLASLALDEGDHEAAREFLRRGLAAGDRPSSTHLLAAGRIAADLGDTDQARRLEREAESLAAERRTTFAARIKEALDALPEEPALASVPLEGAPRPATGHAPGRRPERHVTVSVDAGAASPDDPRVLAALRDSFGYPSLRPGQAAVIERVLRGSDTLAIMPTGAGKSLTFQFRHYLEMGQRS
jgi:Tfp pilus assembly protein PilF